MFSYLYSNDMRISTLEEKAMIFSEMFATNTLPSADEDKSLNNNAHTIGYYLNIEYGENSRELIKNNEFKFLILNFIKKFQYPNPRTKENYEKILGENILISPLRTIVKLLFISKLCKNESFFLTLGEIENFVFYNDLVCKSNGYIDYVNLYNEIIEFKKTKKLPVYIANNVSYKDDWKQRERQLRDIIGMFQWSGFVEISKFSNSEIRVSLCREIPKELNSAIYDILNYDEYWTNKKQLTKFDEIRKDYFEYMDRDIFTSFTRKNVIKYSHNVSFLPKPFLILAGISGTGKTRFVREQAKATDPQLENYCLVPVRPDWHEPSDLLGYVSRLSGEPTYVATDVIRFIIKAWHYIERAGLLSLDFAINGRLEAFQKVKPYWLCLDEMNLAPVEQYFADYLSILETREWNIEGEIYSYQSDPLLKLEKYLLNGLRASFSDEIKDNEALWEFFEQKGIGIPFNLIVAGTVNMDETTHSFSRKVLDRALSFDFGEFYPNDFKHYFEPIHKNKKLTYPLYSNAIALKDQLSEEHTNASVKFLAEINTVLNNTPFKLAYRALNELLLSIISFNPSDEIELQSVFDDFLMCKVLPRIEGDADKLMFDNDKSILEELQSVLEESLKLIWNTAERIDLFREDSDGNLIRLNCRSKEKIKQMQQRLENSGFTHFWS